MEVAVRDHVQPRLLGTAHCTVTVPPDSQQNPRFLFHSDSYDRDIKFSSLWLETCLKFVFKKQLLPIKAQSYSIEELCSKKFNS